MPASRKRWIVSSINPDWRVSPDGFVKRVRDDGMVAIRVLNASNQRQYRVTQYPLPETGNKTSVPVSHLVLDAFGPPKPSPKHVVHHINGDLTDDRIENLTWVTRSGSARLATDARYGMEAAQKVRGRGGQSKISDATAHKVCQAIDAGTLPYHRIAEKYGVSKQFVAQIATGKRRFDIAVQYDFIRNSVFMVVNAWPILSLKARESMLEVAHDALAKYAKESAP